MGESKAVVRVVTVGEQGSEETIKRVEAQAAEGRVSYAIVVDDANNPWALASSGPEPLIEWESQAEQRVEVGEMASPVEVVMRHFERGIVVEVGGALGFVPRKTQLYADLLAEPATVGRFLASQDILVPGEPGKGCTDIVCQDCHTTNCVVAYVHGMLCVNHAYEHELVP